ncbi:unnamed protein product, partial [Heterosigma akashiwo]
MSGINYSKWDHFGSDESESDDDSNMPQVTRLENPSQIEIHPKDDNNNGAPSWSITSTESTSKAPNQNESSDGVASKIRSSESKPTAARNQVGLAYSVQDLGKNGGSHTIQGDSEPSYIWSQDRHEVILSIPLVPGAK